MTEFKDQLDATEKEKVTKHLVELRELAVKGQAGDESITADAIREKINEAQQASLGLFQKVCLRLASLLSSVLTVFCRYTRSVTRKTTPRLHQRVLKTQRRRIKCLFSCFSLLSCGPLSHLIDLPYDRSAPHAFDSSHCFLSACPPYTHS